jgi:hypothetical protein
VFEYRRLTQRTFFRKGFEIGKPAWIISAMNTLALFFAANFAFFVALSYAASPETVNGRLALSDHGTIMKALTTREYLSLKADEL